MSLLGSIGKAVLAVGAVLLVVAAGLFAAAMASGHFLSFLVYTALAYFSFLAGLFVALGGAAILLVDWLAD